MKTFKLAKTAVATLALCSGFAQAIPVTDWIVTDTASFLESSITPRNNGALPNTPNYPTLTTTATTETLAWGAPFAPNTLQSSIVIDNAINGGPIYNVPNGTLVPTIKLTHNNFPITGPSLESVTIIGSLTLKGVLPSPPYPGSVTPELKLPFTVKFLETTNDPNGNPAHTGNCVDGTANGAGLNINGCGDIFVVDFEATAFPFFYEGYNYLFEFAAAGFGPLTPGACAAVPGAPANCKGFKTAENLATPAEFAIRITALPEEVPEPGTLALMGLGMASLGWIGRRRKQKQG